MTEATHPYLASRRAAEVWAEDGDKDAAIWLERHPAAIAFYVEAGVSCGAVLGIYAAGTREWLKEVLS